MVGRTDNHQTYQQQPDAILVQANPVSDTFYTVLPTTSKVQLNSVEAVITWAVTQPTNLRIIVTVDGIPKTYTVAAPVSNGVYLLKITPYASAANQILDITVDAAFILAMRAGSGRSVKVEIAVTWAVTQPTPLVSIVKYARR